jgi:hypothetical protein
MKTMVCLALIVSSISTVWAQTPEQVEFFESRIRPVLAQECYSCHSTAAESQGNLVLDSRPGWQAGGDNGKTIEPGSPNESLLLQAIKHEHEDLKMPKHGAKLDDRTIADFEKWIRDGAADPREAPPSKEQYEKETSWTATLKRRADWWSLVPLSVPPSNDISAQVFAHEIDRLIESEINKQGLQFAGEADENTLRRRLSFILTGLPPTIAMGTIDHPYEAWIDELLASPHFGEKWARHFMDWVRYAESYGSEGDPVIPYAWRYRDYLIRAFNDDVLWPQMIREAIAGDLLQNPRTKNGLIESAIGIGQLRMVLHGFSPVDSLDEQVTFTDNQIDTITKAFQAFTVSCARCHNHKFDAISQTDFYALYGIFTSTHPAVIDANVPGLGDKIRRELESIKKEIKETLTKDWLARLPKDLDSVAVVKDSKNSSPFLTSSFDFHGLERIQAGEFSIHGNALRVHPSGYLSNKHSQKDRAVLYTDRFQCGGGTLWFRMAGNGGVKAKYVVQNYPRTGTIHKAVEFKEEKDESLSWRKLSLDFWQGDEIFLQVTTAADMPAEHRADAPSWFILTDALITHDAMPPANPVASTASPRQLVEAWINNSLTNVDAESLDRLIQAKELPLDSIAALLHRYRDLETNLPTPTRVPGVIEANAKDAPLYVRGDHKQAVESVPRRFLEVLDPTPFDTSTSGRLELADRIADMKSNPLTARVVVNRLWHHVFGRGLVTSVDNFGKLGDLPSHPELLDLLAQRFVNSGGSVKQLLKEILLTRTFRRSSHVPPTNTAVDAENRLLTHFPLRRLEAESIRDSIVALTGKLNMELYGEPIESSFERRSVYVKVIRNKLDPFLTTFDAPVPFSTRGKRDATNVPAQSLTLLNDPNVIRWSRDWAKRMIDKSKLSDELRVRQMFRESLAREASDDDVKKCVAYVKAIVEKAIAKQRETIEQEKRIVELGRDIDAVMEPARKRLGTSTKLARSDQSVNSATQENSMPLPLAEWTFEKDTRDTFGNLALTLAGAARVENGALVLDGQSMAESGSLPKQLTAKTLEAWVMLDSLTQQGGGVLTVQGKDGVLFDSIVFGEKQAGHWVAGSDNFSRSQLLEGPMETEAAKRPVHVAVVYQSDGTITGYREGKPYGQAYRKAPGAVFDSEVSQVLLGCRHGKPLGNHGLRGRIYRARLYDRALTGQEIATTSRIEDLSITDSDVLASLSGSQREQVIEMQNQLSVLTKSIEATRANLNQDEPELQAWSSLAQSLINLKEFIYLR